VSASFEMLAPDYFTTGAVGPPGQRVFYLQGRENGRVMTLKVEKEQIAALAEYVAGLLAKLPDAGTVSTDLPLLEPVNAVWAVGTLGLGYDESGDRLVVIANEAVEQDEEQDEEADGEEAQAQEPAEQPDDPPDGATARFLITRAQASAFVERARGLVRAGRPICPMCSQPKDAAGHICPRSNGHAIRRE
jgi:uncharacterized repeat protein (TIGR03847 family)